MANEKNLIPINKRTKSEQREIAQKGGQASGKVRRKKKLLKDCMLDLLELPVNDMRRYKKLARMGIDAGDIDNRALLTAALFMRAASGDVFAFKEIRDLIGETDAADENGQLERLIDGLKDE